MADLAFVFHWPPDQMDRLTIGELMRFRELAVQRHNDANRSD